MKLRLLCKLFLLVVFIAVGDVHLGKLGAATETAAGANDGIQPLITTSELLVGQNRFAFGLLKAGKLLEGADVKLRLYALDGGEAELAAEINVPYQAVKSVKQERSVHRHADGVEHVHGNDSSIAVSTWRNSVSLGPVIGESNSS
jgi:hypothetical protein